MQVQVAKPSVAVKKLVIYVELSRPVAEPDCWQEVETSALPCVVVSDGHPLRPQIEEKMTGRAPGWDVVGWWLPESCDEF